MKLYDKLVDKAESLALVGLGYVGMPIAVAFARKGLNVIGFDLNKEKIELYKNGIDPTKEVGDEVITQTTVQFTADEKELQKAKFIIVAVPTPSRLYCSLRVHSIPRLHGRCLHPDSGKAERLKVRCGFQGRL